MKLRCTTYLVVLVLFGAFYPVADTSADASRLLIVSSCPSTPIAGRLFLQALAGWTAVCLCLRRLPININSSMPHLHHNSRFSLCSIITLPPTPVISPRCLRTPNVENTHCPAPTLETQDRTPQPDDLGVSAPIGSPRREKHQYLFRPLCSYMNNDDAICHLNRPNVCIAH